MGASDGDLLRRDAVTTVAVVRAVAIARSAVNGIRQQRRGCRA
jgi:hypothetical protein